MRRPGLKNTLHLAGSKAIEVARKQVDRLEKMDAQWTAKAQRSRCGACARTRNRVHAQLRAAQKKLDGLLKEHGANDTVQKPAEKNTGV